MRDRIGCNLTHPWAFRRWRRRVTAGKVSLRALVIDGGVDPFVAEAALCALAFHCFEGRIDRDAFEAFLLRLDEEHLWPRDNDVVWHSWMRASALLGFERLVPRVRAAYLWPRDNDVAWQWADRAGLMQ